MKRRICLCIVGCSLIFGAVSARAEEWYIPKRRYLAEKGHGEYGMRLQYSTENDGLLDTSTFSLIPSIRYSMFERLEVYTEIPYSFAEREDIEAFEFVKYTDDDFGDLFIQLSYELASGQDSKTILNLDTTIPTGKDPYDNNIGTGGGVYKFGTGLTMMKVIDPVVLFTHFGYVHSFSEEFDIGKVELGGDFRFQFGSTLLINPKVRATIHVSGDIQGDAKLNGDIVDGTSGDLVRLGIGLDWDLSEKLKLENNISFGLTDNTPDATISLGLKRKF